MKSFKNLISLLIIVSLTAFFTSCEVDQTDTTEIVNEQIPKDIILKLEEAGFITFAGLFKYEDGYIVENDIFFTEEEINQLSVPGIFGLEKQYRTTNLVSGTRILRVYLDPGFGSFVQNSFNDALSRYNTLSLRLTFQRTTTRSNADIEILAAVLPPGVLGMSAGFPTNGNPAKTITLSTSFFNNSTSRPDTATVIAHEIGHAIGFRHTDFADRSFSCGGMPVNEGPAGVGAILIPGTPVGPVNNSWMLACSNNTNRPFVASDVTALTTLYGATVTPQPGTAQPFYRYFRGGSRANHFYTRNFSELGNGGFGYTLEGIQCRIFPTQASGTIPLYRYYNANFVDHFYTSNFSELGNGASGWALEGIAGYIYPSNASGRIPLYRYYNGSVVDHFYTTSFSELGNGGSGYVLEGVAGYVLPQ